MAQSFQDLSPSFKHYVFSFVVTLSLWLLLVGSLQREELAIGVVVALTVTLVTDRAWQSPPGSG